MKYCISSLIAQLFPDNYISDKPLHRSFNWWTLKWGHLESHNSDWRKRFLVYISNIILLQSAYIWNTLSSLFFQKKFWNRDFNNFNSGISEQINVWQLTKVSIKNELILLLDVDVDKKTKLCSNFSLRCVFIFMLSFFNVLYT